MSLKHVFLDFIRQLNGCSHVANYEALESHNELLNERYKPHLTYRYIDVSERVIKYFPPELLNNNSQFSIYCLVDQFDRWYKFHILGMNCKLYNNIGDYRYKHVIISSLYTRHNFTKLSCKIQPDKDLNDNVLSLFTLITGFCSKCNTNKSLLYTRFDYSGINNPENFSHYIALLKDFKLKNYKNITLAWQLPIHDVKGTKVFKTYYSIIDDNDQNVELLEDVIRRDIFDFLKSHQLEGDDIQK